MLQPLPPAFCWSKFGTEAGESALAILNRKEAERHGGGGVFLWGIGSSIRPSLLTLLEVVDDPVVVFSPMRSPTAARDYAPEVVVRWHSARGLDGRPFALPANAVVTSSLNSRRRHFALVCHRRTSLLQQANDLWIDDENLRNLRTGTRVGSSQVTAVVRKIGQGGEPRYRVAFHAHLTAPYLVSLEDPVPLNTLAVDGHERGDNLREQARAIVNVTPGCRAP